MRPSLARQVIRVLARFSKINRARILSHFPKNEAFDLWSATPFEYNSGGDASPDHSKKSITSLVPISYPSRNRYKQIYL